jgi:hypothetical protein
MRACITLCLFLCLGLISYAGPPFLTDDPEPVEYKHWELYLSTINTIQQNEWEGTSPHIEVNYGLISNVQVHLLLPVNYNYFPEGKATFGYAYTEMGVKYRFIRESSDCPQIGIFPIVEIPTINNPKFGNGKPQIYLPIWAQKSWGKITMYGGAGYWLNLGTDNQNWIFSGLETQYEFSSVVTIGGEIYYHTAETINTDNVVGFNIGGIVNANETTHFIFSLGHTFTSDNTATAYLGIQWTF